jgi:hypothetical protein
VTPPRKRAHKRCGKCGKVVSVRAMVCRRCGKRQRVNPRLVYLGLAFLFLGGLFAVAGAGPGPLGRGWDVASLGRAGSAGAKRAAAAGARAAADGHNPQAVAASDLWAAYNKDPVAADHLYKDRPVTVTGAVVVTPVRDFHGNIVLRLSTGDDFELVHAMLAPRNATAVLSSLSKGQTITVSCTGRGALIGAPILDACSLL